MSNIPQLAAQLVTLLFSRNWQEAHDLITHNPEVLTIGNPLYNAFASAHSVGDGVFNVLHCRYIEYYCSVPLSSGMHASINPFLIHFHKVPPLHLIQRITTIDPQSVCQTSPEQETVLHRLLRCKTPLHHNHAMLSQGSAGVGDCIEMIAKVLIEANPNCLRIADSTGWLPLHVFCANSSIPHFLHIMIKPFRESISTENKGGVTPFSMLLSNSIYGLTGTCQIRTHMVEDQYYNGTSSKHVVMNQYINEWRQWQCVLLMLQASGDDETNTLKIQLPLHLVAVSSLADFKLLTIASLIHKREILLQDRDGNLPLHLACHKRQMKDEEEEPFSKVGILVDEHPEASKIRNMKGYLPLFLAVKSFACDWDNGMEALTIAYPDSLAETDPDHQIYPFMVLASKYSQVDGNRQHDLLSCLFQLIRASPSLICRHS
eukprot:scaffold303_cov285-Chaetoceros_neogracile.AAC.15